MSTTTLDIRHVTVRELQAVGSHVLRAHWNEMAVQKTQLPFDVNWEMFVAGASVGLVRCVGVFAGELLVGYGALSIGPARQSQEVRVATVEGVYLLPEHRVGRNGLHLYLALEQAGRDAGARLMNCAAKAQTTLVGLLQELGYEAIETVYSKEL